MEYFISDLHLGHKKIIEFQQETRPFSNLEDHDNWIIEGINMTVGLHDKLYILGDVAFSRKGLERVNDIICKNIRIVLGNHDLRATEEYLAPDNVRRVYGAIKLGDLMLTHIPIHPSQLRDCINVHGHLHSGKLADNRYINVNVDCIGNKPITLPREYK